MQVLYATRRSSLVGGDGIEPPTSSMSSSWCKLALSRYARELGCSEVGPTSLLSTDSTVQPAASPTGPGFPASTRCDLIRSRG